MKSLIAVIFFSSFSHAQILRPNREPAPLPNRAANYSNTTYRGPNAPVSRPPVSPVRTSGSNWNDPKPKLLNSYPTTPTGIKLDSDWKVQLNAFALKNVVHQSWGYSHSERNYHNSLKIARASSVDVDKDVIFASAFLHDLGGLQGFEEPGVDHAVKSGQLAEKILLKCGFPAEKITLVQDVIKGHVYYENAPHDKTAQVFRDADMLDFLGPMGIARLIAAVMELGQPSNIKTSIIAAQKMHEKLPAEFSFSYTRLEGEKRIRDSETFLQHLKSYTFEGNAY